MPADLLLPAFALTLVVNAVIVAIAIRGLREGTRRIDRAETAQAPAGRARPEPAADPRAIRPVVPSGGVAAAPDAVSTGAVTEPPAPASASPARPRTGRDPAASRGSATGTSSGRRRKFSLPPLDEDHEKVSRSIETFLGVGEESPGAAPLPPLPTTTPDASAPVAVVTVAVLQLEGSGPNDVLVRAVRSTARAADRVTTDRHGRVRVVLPGTGEVAAKAYLRRIRAIVEPIAEAMDPPSRIVFAAATDIDGAVATARRRADRRLAVALRQPAARLGLDDDALGTDHVREPRAAGD